MTLLIAGEGFFDDGTRPLRVDLDPKMGATAGKIEESTTVIIFLLHQCSGNRI